MHDSWLIGTSAGVYDLVDGGACERLGAYQFRVTALDRHKGRVLAATGSGLWEVRTPQWLQHHDETLTEVLDVIDAGDHTIVASAYGVATGTTDAGGVPRWNWLSDELPVAQRFAQAVLQQDDGSLLVGTDGGLLHYAQATGWAPMGIADPVRCLATWRGGFLAGSDKGLLASTDGRTWAATGPQLAVYAVDVVDDTALIGTEDGVWMSSASDTWMPAGLAGMRVAAVCQHPSSNGLWYAGGVPGGLWRTGDHGQGWTGVPQIRIEVEAISAPQTVPGDRS